MSIYHKDISQTHGTTLDNWKTLGFSFIKCPCCGHEIVIQKEEIK